MDRAECEEQKSETQCDLSQVVLTLRNSGLSIINLKNGERPGGGGTQHSGGRDWQISESEASLL